MYVEKEDDEDDEEEEEIPITNELYLMLPAYLTQVQQCVNCGVSYKECHNIGRHRCLVHPGVRLLTNDHVPQRAFFSCCGRTLAAKGCLQMDHASCVFSETNARRRLSQIRDFATVIVPHTLLRFLTRPLLNARLFDSHMSYKQRMFRHRSRVLREVSDRSEELILTHQLQHVDPHDDVAFADAYTVKEFDIEHESFLLYKSSKESPLYIALASRSSRGKTRSVMLKECDNAWRSKLGKKAEEEDDENEEVNGVRKRGMNESVPFVIIGRINTQLDVRIK